MINGIRLNQKNISPNQRRIRLQEIAGLKISNRDKNILKPRSCKCINETSMKQIPANRKQNVPPKTQPQPEDEIDLEEILKEMGYEDENEEIDEVGSMSKDELKQMIEDIVMATLDEQDDLNEIIENLTKR